MKTVKDLKKMTKFIRNNISDELWEMFRKDENLFMVSFHNVINDRMKPSVRKGMVRKLSQHMHDKYAQYYSENITDYSDPCSKCPKNKEIPSCNEALYSYNCIIRKPVVKDA